MLHCAGRSSGPRIQEQGRTWYFTEEMCKSGEADKVEAIFLERCRAQKVKARRMHPSGSNYFVMGLGTIAQMKC